MKSCAVFALMCFAFVLEIQTIASANAARAKARMSDQEEDEDDSLLVKTNSGSMRGTHKEVLGQSVQLFLGIRYAEPPLNGLRFKRPVPVKPWKSWGVFSATELPKSCQQEVYQLYPGFRGMKDWIPNTRISEDCLYLNIYVPSKLRHSNNASVLVWIHGGAYMTGTSAAEVFDGSVLAATNDVIVATINYRLGVFGFLNLGHEEAPGNMGMLDQVMAIQWIKDNIAHFGGNPDSITLFGESAGGGSVSAHLLSPMSRHLFKRAILQSGSLNAQWSFVTTDVARRYAKEIVHSVGCDEHLPDGGDDIPAIMNCMRYTDARNISRNQMMLLAEGIFPWVPTVDGTFLDDTPANLLEKGNFSGKEILAGTTRDEGSLLLLVLFPDELSKDHSTNVTKEQFSQMVDRYFQLSSDLERKAIKFMYTDWEQVSDNGYLREKQLSDMLGDFMIICPLSAFTEKLASDGAVVYQYKFTHASHD